MKEAVVITQDTCHKLLATGSRPGILYGLPKVHKDNCPIRPILSAIGTCTYNICKFLVPIIAPVTTNQYSINNSFSFVKEVCDLSFKDCFMASFDITSLFTSLPLAETIDICTNLLFADKEFVQGFSRKHFRFF